MATGFAALPPSSPSSTPKKLKQILREPFKALEDPRVKRKPEHLLVDIVAIAILAVRSGANDLVAVETYGKAKQTWLETFLELPNGIPSHDTFSRVLALLNPQQLHECFLSWVAQLADELAIKLINIDGKTARGSYDSLHWILDVTFREDQSRIRNGHGPENLGLLRRLSLNLLKREPSQQSLTQKRYRAAMDNDFVVKVLLGHEAATSPL